MWPSDYRYPKFRFDFEVKVKPKKIRNINVNRRQFTAEMRLRGVRFCDIRAMIKVCNQSPQGETGVRARLDLCLDFHKAKWSVERIIAFWEAKN